METTAIIKSENKITNIFLMWFIWHFFEMPKFLFSTWLNYLNFGLDYFSIPLLLKTFFSPWRRYKWRYPKGFDIKEYFSVFVSNVVSRFLGALCRVVLILIGLIFQVFIVLAGIIAILFWILIPFILISLFLIFIYV